MTEQRGRRGLPILIGSLLLTPLIFLFHNLNFYRGLLLYEDVFWLAALYLLLPLLLYAIFRYVLRQRNDLSALITVLCTLLFFFFGALQDAFLQHNLSRFLSKTYVLPFLFLALVAYLLVKKPAVTRLFRTLSFGLLFFLLSELVLLILKLPDFSEVPPLKEKVALPTTTTKQDSTPNIYHLIFDGYANSATLQQLFNFKNPLDSFLLQNGFFLAGKTKSNYNFTPYSLAATLNLNYLQLDEKALVRDFKNYLLGAEVYKKNPVFPFFTNQGYQVRYFSVLNDYEHLDQLGTFVPKTPFYAMRNQTLERIFLNPWLWQKAAGASAQAIPKSVKESLRYYVKYNRQALAHAQQVAANKQFNFTHFLLPHEPYVFSKSSVDLLQLNDLMDYQHGYIEQVKYANHLIKGLVAELRKNKRNIIILQGDHGFRDYDTNRYSPLTQNEALNAFYFPDGNYQALYDSISPVNTYRVILNQFFGQNLPLLHDAHFVPAE